MDESHYLIQRQGCGGVARLHRQGVAGRECVDTSRLRRAVRSAWRGSIDILLRVNAEESRAVGVSGSQLRTPPLYGNLFNSVVVVGGCLAVPNRRYSYPRCRWLPSVVFASRESLTRQGIRRYLRACSTDGHETNPSRIRVHRVGVSDTVSSHWISGKAASKGRSESGPFRPDHTVV